MAGGVLRATGGGGLSRKLIFVPGTEAVEV